MTRRETESVRRTCKFCGRKFWARKGEAKRRGCPDCEPPLIPPHATRGDNG